ncbi:LysR family transcriptional regulator [Neoasaia chiangmaiensis NBRC 101099]|uniref:LysR family transcriptional regulator n=3 Tax=Neoasaia chiangmaiensis TaxID=320497 RepID=A0A1U9KQN1_9PROT|nr:LysR family transcriptional regulator [Neoasaia chiangmaiensis]AQS88118.1 LysR family transcriptional regulator [Neoasaia chiangmaiensis]GBR40066.1 LysR family transcriptional regulator [Neoasaia chiangmaiensis NBRC 101099]GEN14869.1 transcriptional regulator [Neoasaia chiangmaiensis]
MARQYDLNLLYTLQALLEESSVSGAARRLRLSSATVSRTLARIRTTFRDPILVPSGRKMVLTPRALELQPFLQDVLATTRSMAQQQALPELATMAPSLTIRAADAVMAIFAAPILNALRRDCPGCHLRFAPEADGDETEALRKGEVDLYIGATRELQAEIRRQTLFSTRVVGLARSDHPVFDAPITPKTLTQYDHIAVSRRGRRQGPIDVVLEEQFGLLRNVALVVPTYFSALDGLPYSDMILSLPDIFISRQRPIDKQFRAFVFPFELEPVTIFHAWHPRYEADPLRRWLRQTVGEVIRGYVFEDGQAS